MGRRDWPAALVDRAVIQGGLLSRKQLEGFGVGHNRLNTLMGNGQLIRVTRNVYEVTRLERFVSPNPRNDEYEWARFRSAWTGLLSVENSVATGAAALVLHGVWGLPVDVTPEIALFRCNASSGAPGVRIRQFARRFPVQRHHGRLIAMPVPALIQALPELGGWRAVAVLDSALNKELIDSGEIAKMRKEMRGRRGVRALGPWWRLVDGRAGSPMETFARLDCGRAGLPAPELQREIFDGGVLIARADLAWKKADGTWVLVEIDGRAFHENPDALFHDRVRQNRIMLNGKYQVLRFTGRDVMQGRVAPAVAHALRS